MCDSFDIVFILEDSRKLPHNFFIPFLVHKHSFRESTFTKTYPPYPWKRTALQIVEKLNDDSVLKGAALQIAKKLTYDSALKGRGFKPRRKHPKSVGAF